MCETSLHTLSTLNTRTEHTALCGCSYTTSLTDRQTDRQATKDPLPLWICLSV